MTIYFGETMADRKALIDLCWQSLSNRSAEKVGNLTYRARNRIWTPLVTSADQLLWELISLGQSISRLKRRSWDGHTGAIVAWGSGLQLKNWGSYVVSYEAKRSTVTGPSVLWIFEGGASSPICLSLPWTLSTLIFSTPGRCCACSVKFLCKHHIQRSLTSLVAWGDILCPPPHMVDVRHCCDTVHEY